MELRPEDVGKVAEVWRRGLEAGVTGDLEPRGTGVRMRRVEGFAVLQEQRVPAGPLRTVARQDERA
ncbi:hypothetical protein ABZ892_11125 [Streptomyces sp. NPDC046924]|uniref:hypothetical protein n=1 Tax=Streptomyces sp. NPDC046924 TaxID=3155136 RepID=UPI0033EC68E9